jgi:hypothetical protein
MSKYTIDIPMTWDEWFMTACEYYKIPIDEPVVNEIIDGKQCCVTPRMMMDTMRNLEMSRELCAKFTLAAKDSDEVLNLWTGFVKDSFRCGVTFLHDLDF